MVDHGLHDEDPTLKNQYTITNIEPYVHALMPLSVQHCCSRFTCMEQKKFENSFFTDMKKLKLCVFFRQFQALLDSWTGLTYWLL